MSYKTPNRSPRSILMQRSDIPVCAPPRSPLYKITNLLKPKADNVPSIKGLEPPSIWSDIHGMPTLKLSPYSSTREKRSPAVPSNARKPAALYIHPKLTSAQSMPSLRNKSSVPISATKVSSRPVTPPTDYNAVILLAQHGQKSPQRPVRRQRDVTEPAVQHISTNRTPTRTKNRSLIALNNVKLNEIQSFAYSQHSPTQPNKQQTPNLSLYQLPPALPTQIDHATELQSSKTSKGTRASDGTRYSGDGFDAITPKHLRKLAKIKDPSYVQRSASMSSRPISPVPTIVRVERNLETTLKILEGEPWKRVPKSAPPSILTAPQPASLQSSPIAKKGDDSGFQSGSTFDTSPPHAIPSKQCGSTDIALVNDFTRAVEVEFARDEDRFNWEDLEDQSTTYDGFVSSRVSTPFQSSFPPGSLHPYAASRCSSPSIDSEEAYRVPMSAKERIICLEEQLREEKQARLLAEKQLRALRARVALQ